MLSVGVVWKEHKRTDYIIEEASRLSTEWGLLICGGVVDPGLVKRGEQLLGARFRHVCLRRDEMSEVYEAADLFVSAATREGFGLAIVEAMSHGLPVIVHDTAHFRWLVKDREVCLDLSQPGALSSFVINVATATSWRREKGERNRRTVASTYSWDAVRSGYESLLLGPVQMRAMRPGMKAPGDECSG